jgi:hypothetical protein
MVSWTRRLAMLLVPMLMISAVVIKFRLPLDPVTTSELRGIPSAQPVYKSQDLGFSVRRTAAPLHFKDARLQSMADVSYRAGVIVGTTADGHDVNVRAAMLHPLLLSSGLYPHLPEQVMGRDDRVRDCAYVPAVCSFSAFAVCLHATLTEDRNVPVMSCFRWRSTPWACVPSTAAAESGFSYFLTRCVQVSALTCASVLCLSPEALVLALVVTVLILCMKLACFLPMCIVVATCVHFALGS